VNGESWREGGEREGLEARGEAVGGGSGFEGKVLGRGGKRRGSNLSGRETEIKGRGGSSGWSSSCGGKVGKGGGRGAGGGELAHERAERDSRRSASSSLEGSRSRLSVDEASGGGSDDLVRDASASGLVDVSERRGSRVERRDVGKVGGD
jgi:hypothetical protein